MVSLQKTRAVTPVHLMSEEASQAQLAAIEIKQPPNVPAVQTAVTPKNIPLKRQSVFSYLFRTSIGLSLMLILTLVFSLNISAVTMEHLQVVLLTVGSGLFSALSILWGVLRMRTCGAVHKRLIDAENQILQRALVQQRHQVKEDD